ncbi:Saccharopine dehydrogenase [Paraburkholderia sacchari]|uniref:saccharopine dehydrogenase family protein n=1 Tax=Paraburkholderia sacchari TaxID=159450 RepID=UPI0039A4C504
MANYPVVVYGASGYTGMLIMDWLIDQNIPFTAIARDAKRTQDMMAQRVVRLESATYEIVECEHDVEALTAAFTGAKVVCNTVGPFVKFGMTAVEAALRAGCHYMDTTGEQAYIIAVRDTFGKDYAKSGLLLCPSLSYMYALGEIAAELALETPGIDALETASLSRGPMQGSGVTVGSTASIFEQFRAKQYHLWDNDMVEWSATAAHEISVPELLLPVFVLPWGGTSLPVFYQHDSRVRYCRSVVGFYDNPAMRSVHALAQKWDSEIKHLPVEQQDVVLAQIVASTTPSMPPRERTTMNRSVDIAIGRGQLASVRASVNSITPYITTGALQVAGVMKLINGQAEKAGFASACQAFGHRYLLSFLEQRGLASSRITQL